jgi:predicted ATPase/class 3 adenylate cyclase
MRCVSCGFDNPEGMNFCGKCASPLSPRCPQCGFENPAGFAFCGKCSTPLARQSPVASSQLSVANPQPPAPTAQSPVAYTPKHLAERIRAEQATLEARGVPDGERRIISALFADIKGSMDLIEDLDPEEARRIIDPALQLMMDAVHRYEGYVVQSTGDGIFALFGAPIAHEDHAQRALYAALRMQEESKRYADCLRLQGQRPLEIRVGVNTGEVVVRSIRKDDLHTEYTPIGHSTSLAARLQSLATGGGIVVSEPTYRLTEGYFECRALGTAQIKGVSEPVPLYEVLGVGPLRTRLQVAARRGLVRFVGRQAEMGQMQKALALIKAGHGQVVSVMGEPGVGKSRLFHEFKLLSQKGCLVLETFSVSHGKAYAYLPLIELLKNYFQLTLWDDERRRREKVMGKVLALDQSLEPILPYLFFLLGIAELGSSLPQMDSQIRRQRTLDAIKQVLVRESRNQPLILIFEDLHWLDTETQAFLSLLSESVAAACILLLVNYRPEYHHEWGNKTYYTQLRLDPLGQEDAQELLTALLGDEAALQSLKRFILEKTEGNPFFIEEIVQALVEQGVVVRDPTPAVTKPLTDLRLPTTVQGVLSARIDRLGGEEKALLQTLAVIGKEFSLSVLTHVVNKPAAEVFGLLAPLQTAEFIYEQPAFPEPEYIFKHALTQEVAYNSVLSERRKALHERTAQTIEALFPSRLDDYYSELAHHYSRSGSIQKAMDYLQLAGEQAVRRSANIEAISHFTAALELLGALPETAERTQRELTLQVALGVPLLMTKGFAAPEARRTYARARALCQQLGETPQLFSVLRGLWEFYHVGAELQTARVLADQLLSIAHSVQDSSLLLEAHSTLAMTLISLGEQTTALKHAEQLLALYSPQQHHAHAFLYGGYDPGVNCLGSTALSLWLLGYPNQALKRLSDAFTLAQELSHPNSLAITQCYAAQLHQLRREGVLSQERAEAAQTFASEYGFPLAWGTILGGWARAEQGQGEVGLVQMRQDLESYESTGAKAERPYFLALMAEAYGQIGQVEEGLTALAEALAAVDKTGERWCEAELYRLKGELTLQSNTSHGQVSDKFQTSHGQGESKSEGTNPQPLIPHSQAEAEACFHKAIEIARKQQAKSWELRAITSLARLWQQQGKKNEAHSMLAEIYGWFTEGFDTKDLQGAKSLLEELETTEAKKRHD